MTRRSAVDLERRPEPTEVEAPSGIPTQPWNVFPGKALTLAAIDRRRDDPQLARRRALYEFLDDHCVEVVIGALGVLPMVVLLVMRLLWPALG